MTPTSEQVAPHTARFLDRMEQEELAIVRRAYAKHVLANADVDDRARRGGVRRGAPRTFPRAGAVADAALDRAVMYRRRATIRSISIRTRWSASFRSAA